MTYEGSYVCRAVTLPYQPIPAIRLENLSRLTRYFAAVGWKSHLTNAMQRQQISILSGRLWQHALRPQARWFSVDQQIAYVPEHSIYGRSMAREPPDPFSLQLSITSARSSARRLLQGVGPPYIASNVTAGKTDAQAGTWASSRMSRRHWARGRGY